MSTINPVYYCAYDGKRVFVPNLRRPSTRQYCSPRCEELHTEFRTKKRRENPNILDATLKDMPAHPDWYVDVVLEMVQLGRTPDEIRAHLHTSVPDDEITEAVAWARRQVIRR